MKDSSSINNDFRYFKNVITCDGLLPLCDFSFRVSRYCESRGWKRIYNKHREDFKLKWCETKSPANYCHFREGSAVHILIITIGAEETKEDCTPIFKKNN